MGNLAIAVQGSVNSRAERVRGRLRARYRWFPFGLPPIAFLSKASATLFGFISAFLTYQQRRALPRPIFANEVYCDSLRLNHDFRGDSDAQNFNNPCVDITPDPDLCITAKIHARRIARRVDSERENLLVNFIIENLTWIMVLRGRRQDIFAMSRGTNSEVMP
jgi:hypothetical protein